MCCAGVRGIGPHVAERFIEIVKLRNRLAKLLGFIDYYDYKVSFRLMPFLACFFPFMP